MPQYIYINSYPGVGKLTVAKELEKLIPGSKVYHNHLLIDPVAPLVERTSPHYHTIRASLRRHVLDIIATSEATQHVTWVFTDSRSSSPIGSAAAQDYENAAIKRGVPFVSVILQCELEENLKRVANEGRGANLSTGESGDKGSWNFKHHEYGSYRGSSQDPSTYQQGRP